MKKNLIYLDFELDCLDKEIKDILNNGFKICCEKCHSIDYEIYPTGYIPKGMMGYDQFWQINDIWYICKKCKHKFPSNFYKKE